MNIGVDIRPLMDAQRTGVGEYVYNLLNQLFAADTENRYFLFSNVFKPKPHVHQLWADRKNVMHCAFKIPNKLLNASLAFCGWPHIDRMIEKKYLGGAKLDCFLSPNPYFAAYSSGCTLVQVVHDCAPKVYPEFFSAYERCGHRFIYPKSFKQASQVIAVSENTKRDLVALLNVDEKEIYVIRPGLSPLFLNPVSDEQKTEVRKKYNLPGRFVLFLGTLEQRKNVVSLIKAFDEWQRVSPGAVSLVLAGKEGFKANEVMSAIQNSSAKERIFRLPYIDETDKPALYSVTSLFVYPSFYEGFGFPPLEALSQGTPVMVSHTSSMGEIFGRHVLLVDPYKPLEMARAMEEYFVNNEKIHPRAERVAFARSFGWRAAAEQVKKMLLPR